MEALGHFLFELVKIFFLTVAYTILAVVSFRLIGKLKPESRINKYSGDIWTFSFVSGAIISISLFLFMFTYFGDHGLGDSARIPIGHFKVVKQINGNSTYIENTEGEQFGISTFAVRDGKLYAATDPNSESGENGFVIWNLRTDKWALYKTELDYRAADDSAPKSTHLGSFQDAYNAYWNGWRFWLLP